MIVMVTKRKKLKKIFISAFVALGFLASVFAVIFCSSTFGAKEEGQATSQTSYQYYTNADNVVNELIEKNNSGSELADSYSMMDNYPIVPENQTTSQLCWSYASMKSLETSIMVQTGEYYNFSDIAVPYLGYTYGYLSSFNQSGNFETFAYIAYNYGLVYESMFENDNFFDITSSNFREYDYVLDEVDKTVLKNTKAIGLGSNATFGATLSYYDKLDVVKRYLLEYGGLFAGLQSGVIYSHGVNIYENDKENQAENRIEIEAHAVCLIGWDDRYGFLALNSWGVEGSKYQTFYIPYKYSFTYETLNGFIYEANDGVSLEASTAGNFSTKVLKSDILIRNIFNINETMQLKYTIASKYEFNSVYIKIMKANEDVTNEFNATFSDFSKAIVVSPKNAFDVDDGGTYVIKFSNDSGFIGSNSFYIFTGTEISNLKMELGSAVTIKYDELMVNAFINGSSSETFYISALKSYYLKFFLMPFNQYKNTKKQLNFSISEVYKSYYDGTEFKKEATDLYFSTNKGDIADVDNNYIITIPATKTIDYKGSKLEFELSIESQWFAGYRKTYTIILFISTSDVTSKNAVTVHYELAGGKNSDKNVTRIPNSYYDQNTGFTKIELFAPTKLGYTFIGWYSDEAYKNEVTAISGVEAKDIKLYAKWNEESVVYFSSDLSLIKIYDYYGNEKNTGSLIYGDKIELRFIFEPFEVLANYNYIAVSSLYINGSLYETFNYVGEKIKIFSFDFLKLKAGNYRFYITTSVIISRALNVVGSNFYNLTIEQKPISFEFLDVRHEYDGKVHLPKIQIASGEIFPSDYDGGVLLDLLKVVSSVDSNVGEYNYEIQSISNSNYTIVGEKSCKVEVVVRKVSVYIDESQASKVYNGKAQKPELKVENLVSGESLNIVIKNVNFISVGSYQVKEENLSFNNPNYEIENFENIDFKITPASITIVCEDVNERIQIAPENRTQLSYHIEGSIFDLESALNISLSSVGTSTLVSGKFEINASYANSNYNATIVKGTYTINGDYTVTYTLPDGTVYVENVKEGENPKGIDDSGYKKPLFSKLKYSEELVNKYDNMYVDVEVESYAWYVIVGGICAIFAIAYFVFYISARKRSNR